MKIEFASFRDLKGVCEIDASIDSSRMAEKIQRNEVLVSKHEEEMIGLLRFSLFWDITPFINMLIIKEDKRGTGFGSELVLQWESMMRERGFQRVMTSSQSDETAQEFYRKLKYKEIGSFEYPGQEPELIFLKELDSNKTVGDNS